MKQSLALICIVFILASTACSGAEITPDISPIPPTEKPTEIYYSLSVSADPTEGGAVAPVEESLLAGMVVQVKAKPAPGYKFTKWSGADTSTSRILMITMDGDRQLTAHFEKQVTKTPEPTPTPTPVPCRKPADVTRDDVGELIEICGKVTNFGDVPCPDCIYGAYSFIILDNELMIISYDWFFYGDWVNNCLNVADTVELLGNNPVLVFKKGDGYAGSECYRDENGSLMCEKGEYFQEWDGCE